MRKDFPKCNTHIDCFANKEGYCIALKSKGFSDVACTFYKTKQDAEEARLKSFKHLVEIGREDLIEKYGGESLMGVNKYNAEGYYDPTAYEALIRIERESKKMPFRPLVYICSPYSGDVEKNVKKAREHCRFALNSGCIPIAMHLLLPQFMDDNNPKERDLALFIDLVIMGKCQEVWVFGDRISDGMAIEIAKAKKRGQGVKYFGFNYKEVSEDA